MKFKHPVTESTKWLINTPHPSEKKNRWRKGVVYQENGTFTANLSGTKAILEPVFNQGYQAGTVPAHFKVIGWR